MVTKLLNFLGAAGASISNTPACQGCGQTQCACYKYQQQVAGFQRIQSYPYSSSTLGGLNQYSPPPNYQQLMLDEMVKMNKLLTTLLDVFPHLKFQ